MSRTKEQYLTKVFHLLKRYTLSSKSELIYQLSKKIDLESDEGDNYSELVKKFGQPKDVAASFAQDLGIKDFTPYQGPPWLKLTLIVSAIFGFFFIVIPAFFIWKFTPVFKVEDDKNRVILLGGLIDINGYTGRVKIFDQYHYTEPNFKNNFDGSIPINKDEIDELVINFNSGVFTFNPTDTNELSWDCQTDKEPSDEMINHSEEILEMDFEKTQGVSCQIFMPDELKLTMDGKDGQIKINEARYDTYVEMKNGKIEFSPDSESFYKYDIDIEAGMKSEFTSSNSSQAYEVQLILKNGTITNAQP